MTAYNLPLANHLAGVAPSRGYGPVPPGQEWSVAIRANNNGVDTDTLTVQVRRFDGTISSVRCNGMPSRVGDEPYDVDTHLTLSAGDELWDASGKGNVWVSYSGTCRSTAA